MNIFEAIESKISATFSDYNILINYSTEIEDITNAISKKQIFISWVDGNQSEPYEDGQVFIYLEFSINIMTISKTTSNDYNSYDEFIKLFKLLNKLEIQTDEWGSLTIQIVKATPIKGNIKDLFQIDIIAK